MPRTLTSRLVPIADKIRTLADKFGMRPYRVWLVHVKWSGTRVGEGVPQVASRRELQPVPRVFDMSSTTLALTPVGLNESGTLMVDQVSAKWTEDDLMGRTWDLIDPALPATGLRNGEFFWEVQEARPTQPPPPIRRYVPTGVPMLIKGGLQWRVTLTKQNAERNRNGTFNPREL